MGVVVTAVAAEVIPVLARDLGNIYRAVFALPPYSEGPLQAEVFVENVKVWRERVGFACVVARSEAQIVGFALGWRSEPGQWWHDTVGAALTADAYGRWLDDCFEFVELALLPEWQGQGIGGQLHDALLAQAVERTAVLSTLNAETRALQLYRRRGWEPILVDYVYPGSDERTLIMGKVLDG